MSLKINVKFYLFLFNFNSAKEKKKVVKIKNPNGKWTTLGPSLKFDCNRIMKVRDDQTSRIKWNPIWYYVFNYHVLYHFCTVMCTAVMMIEKWIILLLFIKGFVSWTIVLFSTTVFWTWQIGLVLFLVPVPRTGWTRRVKFNDSCTTILFRKCFRILFLCAVCDNVIITFIGILRPKRFVYHSTRYFNCNGNGDA